MEGVDPGQLYLCHCSISLESKKVVRGRPSETTKALVYGEGMGSLPYTWESFRAAGFPLPRVSPLACCSKVRATCLLGHPPLTVPRPGPSPAPQAAPGSWTGAQA